MLGLVSFGGTIFHFEFSFLLKFVESEQASRDIMLCVDCLGLLLPESLEPAYMPRFLFLAV